MNGNRRRGLTRSGLVSSASASRLRADGLEPTFDFHQRFAWEHWFLDTHQCADPRCSHRYCNDVRASSQLEVAATQFEIQGRNWTGSAYAGARISPGMVRGGVHRRFNNRQWRPIKPSDHRRISYLVNGYRVLLTRARQGMIIYVPAPEKLDTSRLPDDLDRTAAFLVSCGAVSLDDQTG